jgi:hypothetical protein
MSIFVNGSGLMIYRFHEFALFDETTVQEIEFVELNDQPPSDGRESSRGFNYVYMGSSI